MRNTIAALALGLLAIACEAPDPERDGFVVVDEDARNAGIAVEVSGERHSGALPVAIPEGAEAAVVRPGGVEPIAVEPGELVEAGLADLAEGDGLGEGRAGVALAEGRPHLLAARAPGDERRGREGEGEEVDPRHRRIVRGPAAPKSAIVRP